MDLTTTRDGHTFDWKMVQDGRGWTIDAGCRGWQLEYEITQFLIGASVFALDIENFDDNAVPGDTVFRNAALSHQSGETEAYFFGDGTANFIKGINEPPYNGPDRPCETKTVKLITLEEIYAEIGTDIDLLKMDIEGSEYEILLNMEPIPKQVTVEFHEHTVKSLHDRHFNSILEKMYKHYHISFHQVEPRYHSLDVLFIRRDL
jgi:FkbM family methyltransferase